MKFRETHPSQPISNFGPWHPVDASGGAESFITVSGTTYKLHIFSVVSTDTLVINDSGSDGLVEYLVVAGGGGGGMDMGGGGGAGGVLMGRHTVISGDRMTVTVGAGGLGAPGGSEQRSDGGSTQPGAHQFTISATNGGNSVFGPYTAIGGGYGGSSYFTYTPNLGIGSTGGSGGGTSGYSDGSVKAGQAGTADQGNRGGQGGGQYYSGGGGGAGAPGADSTSTPNGGDGTMCDILGTDLYWGGGGGGAAYSLSLGGYGGLGGGGGGAVGSTIGGASALNPGQPGGGGSPSSQTNTRGGNAGANTGGGGGGGAHYNATNSGGEGGSGIVVVRYPINRPYPQYLTMGLKLYLDANNPSSYPGSGSVWTDLAQGLVFNSVNTQMPYQTVAGAQGFTGNSSGYWRCTSGFQNVNMKNDCTLIMWVYTPTISTRKTIFEKAGTSFQSYEQEIAVTWETSNVWTWYSRQGAYDGGSTAAYTTGRWNMIAIKMTGGRGQGMIRRGWYSINGANWTENYTANSRNAITDAGEIRVGSGYAGTIDAGTIGAVMVYARQLNNAEISYTFNNMRRTYGV
jgi:hypothetical protein